MEKGGEKLAPILSFNNKNDNEEPLVLTKPLKKFSNTTSKSTSTYVKQTADKSCMTDDDEAGDETINTRNRVLRASSTTANSSHHYKPTNLEINLNPHQNNHHHHNNHLNQKSTTQTTTALVIGEIPINLATKRSTVPTTAATSTNAKSPSQLSMSYIDSPTTSTRSTTFKNQIIPYFIMPFNAGMKKFRKSSENAIINFTQQPKTPTQSITNNQIELHDIENKNGLSVVENLHRISNSTAGGGELDDKKSTQVKQDAMENLITTSVSSNYDNVDSGNASKEKILPEREQWARKTEFLLAIIGFSVDLGNIWRFPKVVYENGGGRFLIPYFVQLALCGLPLFYMELALGQYHQTGLFTLWEKICPILKGLAFTAIIIDLFMAIFYNTVIAWAIYYLFLSFNTELPWKNCNKDWNTLCCFPINDYRNMPYVENYSLTSYETYQKKQESSDLIYRVYDTTSIQNLNNLDNNINNNLNKRIVVFNLKKIIDAENLTQLAFDSIQNFFQPTQIKLPSKLDYYDNLSSVNSTHLARIETWIKSYFILNDNKLEQIPRLNLPTDMFAKFFHDSKLLNDFIEKNIFEHYKNKSINIVLNCAAHMNNPTQEFYTRYLTEMHKSTGLEDIGSLKIPMIFCLLLVFITVYFALWQGIKSAGKAVWITAIAPYVVMFILLIRGLTLEGSSIGISFFLSIKDWSSLLEMKVWVDAATQIFFSLGPGFGTIIALSSYNKRTNNCYKDALLTSFINCFTSILSGFVVFSTLGHMAYVQGKSIEEVTDPGPGLIFVTYPQAISMMPGAPIWAIIFFFMLFTLGIDSTFGGLESVITGICDNFPNTIAKKRSWFVLGLISLCFVLALPTVTYGGPYIVHLFDNYTVAPSILIVVFLEVMGVMYAYGCDRFCDDIFEMIKSKPNKFWIVCWKFISPAIVVVITFMICRGMLSGPLGFGNGYYYTGLGEYMAALIVGVPISFIFIYFFYRVYTTPGTLKERLILLTKPSEPWIKRDIKTSDSSRPPESESAVLTTIQASKLDHRDPSLSTNPNYNTNNSKNNNNMNNNLSSINNQINTILAQKENGNIIKLVDSLENTKYIIVNFNHTTSSTNPDAI